MCSNKGIFTLHPTVSLCLPVKENLRLTEVETEVKGCLQIKVLNNGNPSLTEVETEAKACLQI